jgi:hypothetical protein
MSVSEIAIIVLKHEMSPKVAEKQLPSRLEDFFKSPNSGYSTCGKHPAKATQAYGNQTFITELSMLRYMVYK